MGSKAPLRSWGRPFTLGIIPHNLHIESYHGKIKRVLKPNFSILRFCLGLKEIDQMFLRKGIWISEGIRNIGLSKGQEHYNACHPISCEGYSAEVMGTSFRLIKQMGDGKTRSYQLELNNFGCTHGSCLVVCANCPEPKICAHLYTCQCQQYAYRNFCKHSHLLALLKVIPSGIEKSSDVDLRSKQQEVVDGMGCVPSPSCGETKEDDDLGDIIEPEKLPKEYEDFLARIQHLKRFMNSPENSLASKKAIASQLETVPLREIQLTMNPESFPKINRKRTHSPQFRSFFPHP
ncbi:uncharacterized protein LOC131891322 [Tigriopus californicus]|uniref:uncharacterized protein LOC131891322 n=1 Tax=Tigriopus californicus TaxID=6832 RepID=UPI0027D9D868|nr:uncharacterized protein LOC131891322 [Tigriopus californicus]